MPQPAGATNYRSKSSLSGPELRGAPLFLGPCEQAAATQVQAPPTAAAPKPVGSKAPRAKSSKAPPPPARTILLDPDQTRASYRTAVRRLYDDETSRWQCCQMQAAGKPNAFLVLKRSSITCEDCTCFCGIDYVHAASVLGLSASYDGGPEGPDAHYVRSCPFPVPRLPSA